MAKRKNDENEDSTQRGCTPWLLISCVVLTITTAFVYGWGLGAPNNYNHFTEPFLRGENPCVTENEAKAETTLSSTIPPSNENAAADDVESTTVIISDVVKRSAHKHEFNFVLELIKGIPQTIFLIGASVGAITSPQWPKYFNRKRTVLFNYLFCFLSSLSVLLSHFFTVPFLFYLSRFLLGYQGGMSSVIIPPFISEIAPQRVRGAAGTSFQLSLTIGILASQLIGMPSIAGACDRWSWGLAIVFLLPFAGIFALLLLPNSPTQMISTYNDRKQAIADLKKLRGTDNIQADLDNILAITQRNGGNKTETLSILQVLKSSRYRWPMITTIVLYVAQALSGINAVFFYSSKMFAKAGIPPAYIPYANIGTGAINVIITIVAVPLIEKVGRRALILYPMSVMVVVFTALTALIEYNESRNNPTLSIISVALILIFIVCFAIGLGPIPFLFGAEVCRPEAVDSVQSLGAAGNFIGNIFLSLFFPALNSFLGGYVFLIFLVCVLCSVIFLYFKMPEMQNKKIEDAERFWNIRAEPSVESHLLSTTTTA